MRTLVTGSEGFIGRYLVDALIDAGHDVIGIDNFSKYGEKQTYQHPRYKFYVMDCTEDWKDLYHLMDSVDHVVALAAKVGGIPYFHEYAFDLLEENNKIAGNTFKAAIARKKTLRKITVISSSMVYESTNVFPTPEGEVDHCPPPKSTYGLQKLTAEYYARGAWEQYRLPYTIVRPFNCVGIGETRAIGNSVDHGGIKLAMSHVVPDLIQKILKGQYPVQIFGNGKQTRCYTAAQDIARGILACIEHPEATNEDFNISSNEKYTVAELLAKIWYKIHPLRKGSRVLEYVSETYMKPRYKYDVQYRVPDTTKAKNVLGFEAKIPLDEVLDDMIPWIKQQIEQGTI